MLMNSQDALDVVMLTTSSAARQIRHCGDFSISRDGILYGAANYVSI